MSELGLLLFNLGTFEIGTAISTFLFGITTLQAYSYYSRFSDDRWQLKTLVIAVWLMELAHVIAILHAFYTISILQYGDPVKIFGKLTVGMDIATFMTGCIAFLVQGFFTNRVRKITARPFLVALCWILSFLRFVATIGIASVMITLSLAEFGEKWRWLVTVSTVLGAAVDILITVPLCYDLVKKRQSSVHSTRPLLDRLIVMTIQTGLFTSITTLAVVICFQSMPGNVVWMAVYECLPRIFSNSLLAALNARARLRQLNSDQDIHFAHSAKTTTKFFASKVSRVTLAPIDMPSPDTDSEHTQRQDAEKGIEVVNVNQE